MAKISRTRGKNFELAIANILKGKRNHFEAEDIRHPVFSIECKHRKKLPVAVMKWKEQGEAAAEKGKIPLLAMHEQQQEYLDSLVVIRLKHLIELIDGN